MSTSIYFDHITKIYKLGMRHGNIREALIGTLSRSSRLLQHGENHGYIRALDNVNFKVQAGEALGIIGPNGAGKTTILKLISRITRPTSGTIETNGRLASLIELGAGFHPELTGRENIYLNGIILGLSRKDILRTFDQIVAFSELEDFLDTPVKRYSSGMYARLAFSIAIHVEPDILLVDEVLAVGDANFQKKCFDRILRFVNSGNTTIFVSHNLYALEQLCSRLIWLEKGKIEAEGETHEILSAYMRSQDEKLLHLEDNEYIDNRLIEISKVRLINRHGQDTQTYKSGEDIKIKLDYFSPHTIERPHFVLAVWDTATRQSVFIASMLVDGKAPTQISGNGQLSCEFKEPPLMPRSYQVWGEVYAADRKKVLINWRPLIGFKILPDEDEISAYTSLRHVFADAPIKIPYIWELK